MLVADPGGALRKNPELAGKPLPKFPAAFACTAGGPAETGDGLLLSSKQVLSTNILAFGARNAQASKLQFGN
jgi:hypothetical protein